MTRLLHAVASPREGRSGPTAPGFGQDLHSTYLDWWLRTIGITQLACIRCQPTPRTADPQQVIDDALAQARGSAQRRTTG